MNGDNLHINFTNINEFSNETNKICNQSTYVN